MRFSLVRESIYIKWKHTLITILQKHLVLNSCQIIYIITINLYRFIWLLVLKFINHLFYQLLCSLTRLILELFFYIFRVCRLYGFLFLFYYSVGDLFYFGAINSIKRVCLDNINNFVSFLFLSNTTLLLVNFQDCLSCGYIDIHFINNVFDIFSLLEYSFDKLEPNLFGNSFVGCSFIFLFRFHKGLRMVS